MSEQMTGTLTELQQQAAAALGQPAATTP